MANIGRMEAYQPGEETWSSYIDRLEVFMECNAIADERKVCTLLTVVGVKNYNLLRDLCTPAKPRTKTYEELVTMMNEHLHPKPSFIAERYKFSIRNQTGEESISEYIATLKKLSVHCEFGEALNDHIRDRLVSGIKNGEIKKRLISEPGLTYEAAVKIATALEAAERDVLTLESKVEGELTAKFQHMETTGKQKQTWTPRTQAERREPVRCKCCGGQYHVTTNCRFQSYKCHNCGQMGHLSRVCKKKKYDAKEKAPVKITHNYMGEDEDELTLFNLKGEMCKTNQVEVNVEGEMLNMEIDTGTPVSVISDRLYFERFKKKALLPTKLVLKVYNGIKIFPLGKILVKVMHKKKICEFELYIIKNGGPPLLGRVWFNALELQLGQAELNHILATDMLDNLKTKFPHVFLKGLGTFNKGKISLNLKEKAVPKFFKPRPIPFALKEKVEKELSRLLKQGVLTQVEISKWGTPIVPILKPDGSVRICGDYKVTVNPVLEIEHFPLPRIEDLFATLQGGKRFSKIDLSNAYQQVELEENSKELVTISTHKGLFRYNHIPFGVSSAPGNFQSLMEQVLQGLPGVCIFLDDILVTGKNDDEHIERLEAVFNRLREYELRVKETKCEFFKMKIEYLGYKIDEAGLHTIKDKVDAVVKAPEPKNVSQLKSFMGLVNYYGRFVPNMAAVLNPMYRLLQKEVKWDFDIECKKSFKQIKELLTSAEVLVHYDPKLQVKLACDASEYGIGAVISHMQNGEERPIAYASRTLTPSEKKYSQIDKEGLALIFGIKRFNQYLYGRRFTLVTDHKPLLAIFGSKRGIPMMAANRLQRYALFLAGYTYDIEYITSKNNGNADCLSHLPLKESDQVEEKVELLDELSYLNYIEEGLPIKAEHIRKATEKDRVLNIIKGYILHGWPLKLKEGEEELKPYFKKKEELVLEQECLMWGYKIIIPQSFRKEILNELHSSHLGIVKMKSRARSYFWWPSMDKDIEEMSHECTSCLLEQPNPEKVKLHVWELPEGPWRRIHLDYLGPFRNKLFLMITDAFSKWIEVFEVKSTGAEQTINILRATFARYGLPSHVVSDNGPPFTSGEFKKWIDLNGIRHTFSPPYHPATNGLAENSVKTLKNKVRCIVRDNVDTIQAVYKFLFDYRNSIHSTTGESPAKLMMGRQLRSRLDLIRPDLRERVHKKQEKQIKDAKGKGERNLNVGDVVVVKDYSDKNKTKWTPGTITDKMSPVTYQVQVSPNKSWKRHIDQVAQMSPAVQKKIELEKEELTGLEEMEKDENPSLRGELKLQEIENEEGADVLGSKERRYPTRERRKPIKLSW